MRNVFQNRKKDARATLLDIEPATFIINFKHISSLSVKYFDCQVSSTFRSSPPHVFLRKGVLKICSKFTGEHSC